MKVCIQAGHKDRMTGATGAPGERDWTTKIVPMIAERLRKKDVEVYETNADAFADPQVTGTDWDLFLAIHYDADIYGDRGGFVDYPDPSADMVWETSKQRAYSIGSHYFKTTGIPEKPSRSNANTKFYYMWQYLTANTPCVILECGVGWRKPEDFETLRKYDFIADTLADAVLHSLGMSQPCDEYIKKIEELEQELKEMRESRDKWKRMYKDLEEKYEKETKSYKEQIENLQKSNAELTAQLSLLTRQYETLLAEKSALEKKLEASEAKLEGVSKELEETSKALEDCRTELGKLKVELAACKKKCKQKICEFSYFERVLSLITCLWKK